MGLIREELHMSVQNKENDNPEILVQEEPQILEEIVIEELAIDGICGVY